MAMPSRAGATCDWWQTDGYPEGPTWHTDCGGCTASPGDQALAAEMQRNMAAGFCPWCGRCWGEVDLADVEAEWESEREYRDGIRRGLYGY